MKRIVLASIIFIFGVHNIFAAILGTVSSTTILGCATVSISGGSYTFTGLIADFNSGAIQNAVGGSCYPLNIAGDKLMNISFNATERVGPSGYGMKLIELTSNATDWVGAQMTLGPLSGTIDVSTYTTFNFDIKTTEPGRSFKIEFVNLESTKSYVYLTDYVDTGTSTGWTHVEMPIDAFANFRDTNSITSLQYINFVFENGYETACGLTHSSTIYIDNMAFGTTQQNVVRIDHFGDNYAPNSLGCDCGVMPSPTNAVVTYDETVYHNSPRSMKFDYSVPPGNWGGYWMKFGGGADGQTPSQHNFSAYGKLRLSVKGASGLTPPTKFVVELQDGLTHSAFVPDNTTTPGVPISSSTWTTYDINLSSFSGLDTKIIQQMNIVFQDGTAGAQIGTVYFDEIEFVR
jgi:hypothetical protein